MLVRIMKLIHRDGSRGTRYNNIIGRRSLAHTRPIITR